MSAGWRTALVLLDVVMMQILRLYLDYPNAIYSKQGIGAVEFAIIENYFQTKKVVANSHDLLNRSHF